MKYKILVGGVIGVPVTVVEYLNGDHMRIVGNEYTLGISKGRGYINNKRMYSRIFYIIGLDRYTISKDKLIGGRAGINGVPKYARVFIRRNI